MSPKAEMAFEAMQERDAPWNRIVRLENHVAELERALLDVCMEADNVMRLTGNFPTYLVYAVNDGYKVLNPSKEKKH